LSWPATPETNNDGPRGKVAPAPGNRNEEGTMRGRQVLIATTALTAALVSQAAVSSAQSIKIGLIEPFSGRVAAIGTDLLEQWKYLADDVNKSGGVLGGRKLEVVPLDNAMIAERTIQQLKSAIDKNIRIVAQGVGSNHAINIIKFLGRHNRRNPGKSVLYLNHSAVTTAFTGKLCSFWHFRFDANVDQKVAGLVTGIKNDPAVKKVYMINQNYAYGKSFRAAAVRLLKARAGKVKLVGDELIVPFGKVQDFTPYIAKIQNSGADTVLTGNWGPDLVRFVKAAAASGLKVQFYTIYGGITSSIAGYGPKAGLAVRIKQINEHHENTAVPPRVAKLAAGYRKGHGKSWFSDRYRVVFEMLVKAINKAKSANPKAIAYALEGMQIDNGPLGMATMRAKDHQIHFPLIVSQISATAKVPFIYNNKNFKIGWRTTATAPVSDLTLPTACKMKRPK
jgi:branched-chain amino acid transport system substrate-binding protein